MAHSDLQALVDELLHCGSHTLTYTTRYTVAVHTVYENFLNSKENGRMMFGDKSNRLKKAFLAGLNSINEPIPTINNNNLKVIS